MAFEYVCYYVLLVLRDPGTSKIASRAQYIIKIINGFAWQSVFCYFIIFIYFKSAVGCMQSVKTKTKAGRPMSSSAFSRSMPTSPTLLFLRRYALMKSCWHQQPEMRPNCATLLLHLNQLYSSMRRPSNNA